MAHMQVKSELTEALPPAVPAAPRDVTAIGSQHCWSFEAKAQEGHECKRPLAPTLCSRTRMREWRTPLVGCCFFGCCCLLPSLSLKGYVVYAAVGGCFAHVGVFRSVVVFCVFLSFATFCYLCYLVLCVSRSVCLHEFIYSVHYFGLAFFLSFCLHSLIL